MIRPPRGGYNPPVSRGDGDDEGEDLREEEYPERQPDADEEGTWPCPRCGASIHIDASICPRCDASVTPGAAPPSKAWPWWMWLGLLLAAAVALGWALGA